MGGKKKEGTKVTKPINIYSFWDFDNKDGLSQKELIEKNLKKYIDECEKAFYRPKFREYLMDNEAVLNDALRYAKELGSVDENATIDDISFEYGEYRIPYGYYKFLGDFGMFTPDGEASPIKPLSLAEYDFDKAVEFFADSKKLRTNELLQQFENGAVREKYRKMVEDGELTAEQLEEIIRGKRSEVVREVVDESVKRFSLVGYAADGMEIYETTAEVKNLSYADRINRFIDLMSNEYRGRTVKFTRNGHTYYAKFESGDIEKNIYGDKRSDKHGYRAKINTGADGDIFTLAENSVYSKSGKEQGKAGKAHKGVQLWDYFVKRVQIDNRVYDVVVNIRKTADEQFVYSLQLNEDKKIKPSPLVRTKMFPLKSSAQQPYDVIVPQDSDFVKRKFSLANLDTEYLEIAKNPEKNEARLREMVDEAARKQRQSARREGYNVFGETVDGESEQYASASVSRVDESKKSYYNEYQTNALIWARSRSRQVGDLKVLNRNGEEFVLIEATEDGFIELVSGDYKEVQTEYERIYSEKDTSFYEDTQEIRSEQDGNMWDLQYVENGRDASGNSQQIGSERFQVDNAGNNEYLRNGDKGTSSKGKLDRGLTDSPDTRYTLSNTEVLEDLVFDYANKTLKSYIYWIQHFGYKCYWEQSQAT